VLSRIRPGQTVVMPESHNAAAWETPVVKTPLPFMGVQPPVPVCHTNPDPETDVAQLHHEEVSQSCVPKHPLAHDDPPPETQP
jgi:hypothetical protein